MRESWMAIHKDETNFILHLFFSLSLVIFLWVIDSIWLFYLSRSCMRLPQSFTFLFDQKISYGNFLNILFSEVSNWWSVSKNFKCFRPFSYYTWAFLNGGKKSFITSSPSLLVLSYCITSFLKSNVMWQHVIWRKNYFEMSEVKGKERITIAYKNI